MNILFRLANYLQRYKFVQIIVQAHRHSRDMKIGRKWSIYPSLYRILQNLIVPSHENVRKIAHALLDQGVPLGDFYLARSLFLQNKLDEAEYHICLFLKNEPRHSDGLYLLVEIKSRKNQKKEAFFLLKDMLTYSKRGKTWQHLSNLVENLADFECFHSLFVQVYPNYDEYPLAYDLSSHLSNAAMRARNVDFALQFWRKQYRLLQDIPPTQLAKQPIARRYSDTMAEKALGDLKCFFEQQHIEFFLISGTLLGCIREKKFLGHDKDIDIGVWETYSVHDLANILYNSGCFDILPIYSPDILVIRHVNGITIDIFIHHREENDFWHAGGKSKWHNSPFELTSYSFLNDNYMIPSNYDLYLTENYGSDWRIPKTNFDSTLDTPNMEIVYYDEFLVYLYKKIIFSLHKNKKPSECYLNILRKYGEPLD